MNLDPIYSLLKFYRTPVSNYKSRKLLLIPFKYPDDYLAELSAESYLEIEIDELYKHVFESIISGESLVQRFVRQYGLLCELMDARILIDECCNIKRMLQSQIEDNKLDKFIPTMTLHRADEGTVIILFD